MSRRIDLSGMKFGRLLVVERGENKCGLSTFICVCECSRITQVFLGSLKSGRTKSCGCLQREVLSKSKTTHGNTKGGQRTKEYKSWQGIIQRCTNSKLKQYSDYGGRGITVCERWFSFENFLADMGLCPKGFSIDRKDNNGNYEPGNCRWTDRITQMNNMRSNHIIEHEGKKGTVANWAKEKGIQFHTLNTRLNKFGWSVTKALATPVHKRYHIIEYEGQKKTMTQWAKEKGIKPITLSNRLNTYGWSVAKALTMPVGKYVKGESNNG